jgi:hypothetical protein
MNFINNYLWHISALCRLIGFYGWFCTGLINVAGLGDGWHSGGRYLEILFLYFKGLQSRFQTIWTPLSVFCSYGFTNKILYKAERIGILINSIQDKVHKRMFDNLLDQPVIITWVGWIRDFAKQSYGSKPHFREMVMKFRIHTPYRCDEYVNFVENTWKQFLSYCYVYFRYRTVKCEYFLEG